MQPARTKFRKAQRGRIRGHAATGNKLVYGEFGLQSVELGYLKTNQIEAARKALTHFVKRGGKVWVRVLTDKPFSARPAETRMGGGKGAPTGYIGGVRPGHIIFEIAGVSEEDARQGFKLAAFKLPLKVRMVKAQ
ncbi:50S ribosomal protein L16 [Candidatus Saganbacteria bacterium]|nr:50S ribosomal protein L16 [Candidatus Saganbacteria bacterium]